MRAVMSARSSERPRLRNSQASSWLIVESAMPATRAARSVTQLRCCCVAVLAPRPFHRRHEVLMTSHASVERVSRARRAFSRAASQDPETALGLLASKTRRAATSE